MSDGFAPEWLAARDRYDVAALDQETIALLLDWVADQPSNRPLRLVDLGCGTGNGLRRALCWLSGRPVQAYAVDSAPGLLAKLAAGGLASPHAPYLLPGAPLLGRGPELEGGTIGRGAVATAVVTDVLGPLDATGGPPDGTVDLVISHAVADLLPLDRFAARVAALLRPGGRAHLALTYDGETTFAPTDDPALDRRVLDAYHRHMDLERRRDPAYGGSMAGRRLPAALLAAGLEVVRAAPSIWDVRAVDGPTGRAVLDGLIGFVVSSLSGLGELPAEEIRRWERARRAALDAGDLRARVRHIDVLTASPDHSNPGTLQTAR